MITPENHMSREEKEMWEMIKENPEIIQEILDEEGEVWKNTKLKFLRNMTIGFGLLFAFQTAFQLSHRLHHGRWFKGPFLR